MVRGLGLLAIATTAAAACSDPSIQIDLQLEDEALDDKVRVWSVSVIDAEAVGAAIHPGDLRTATCDDLGFGMASAEVLEGARRASASGDAGRITGVPRLGEKLVFVEAKNANGHRVGAGCTPLGTIETDTPVTVTVEDAPRVQELGRTLGTTTPTPVTLIATKVWDDGAAIANRAVDASLWGSPGNLAGMRLVTDDNGVAVTPVLDAGDTVGPLQTVVRVRWAEEPLRVASFVPWPGATAVAIPASSERMPPAWMTGVVTAGAGPLWRAFALHSRMSDDADELVVVTPQAPPALGFDVATFPSPGVRALVIWTKELWSLQTDGWYKFTAAGMPASPTIADAGGRALELFIVERCFEQLDPTGILARRNAAGYTAYSEPGVPATSGLLVDLVNQIGADHVVAQLCATGPEIAGTDLERVIIVQASSGLRAIRVKHDGTVSAQNFPLLNMTIATDVALSGKRGLAGALATLGGPRVISFRYASYDIEGTSTEVAVQSNAVDVPLAGVPTSLVVHDLDGDGLPDVLALLPTPAGPRIQTVMGTLADGEPLSAITGPLPGGRDPGATSRMLLEQIDPVDPRAPASENCLELVVLTPGGVAVIRGSTAGDPDGQIRCPLAR